MKSTIWTPVITMLTLCCLLSCQSSPDHTAEYEMETGKHIEMEHIISAEDLAIKAEQERQVLLGQKLHRLFLNVSPAFNIDDYLHDRDLHDHDEQFFARNGNMLYILQRNYPGSRILVLNLIDNRVEAGIDLIGGDWFTGIGWSESIQKLICLDASGAIVLLDPANNYSQEIIEFEQEAFPIQLAIQGALLLVSHHNESRIDAFDTGDSTITFKRSYISDGSSFVFLDERYCFTGGHNLNLLDLETGTETRLITLPPWGKYATVASCLEYDQESRTAYFRHNGLLYAYRADSDTVPAHSTVIDNNTSTLRVNTGFLYRLDPNYYAFDNYHLGIKSRDGILSIISTDAKGRNLRLSRSGPFLKDSENKVILTDDPSKARTTFALIRADSGHSPMLETGGAFARALLDKPHYIQQMYVLSFNGKSILELTERLAQDEKLRQACAGKFSVQSIPGDRSYLLMDKPSAFPHELSAIEAVLFPSNPWNESSSYILIINPLTDDTQKVDLETRSITRSLYAYELPSRLLNTESNKLAARIPLWTNPDEPEAEAERLRSHLAQQYPEFISLELLEE